MICLLMITLRWSGGTSTSAGFWPRRGDLGVTVAQRCCGTFFSASILFATLECVFRFPLCTSMKPDKKQSAAPKLKARQKTSPPALYTVRAQKRKAMEREWLTHPAHLTAADWNRLREDQMTMSFLETEEVRRVAPRPFLKWVGGKTSLLGQLERFFPRQVDRYIEPFLGGGAVFFFLKYKFPEMRAFLRDSNKELINCYRVVRDRPIELMRWLDHHSAEFKNHGSTYFYAVRAENGLTDDLARAARTIFLNKTCFNGLYRVNAKGEFNAPVGSSLNPGLTNVRTCWRVRSHCEMHSSKPRTSA